METNAGVRDNPGRDVTSLEFHLALLNKAHEVVPDAELLEYCMWLIPFISGPGHLWWSIYPSDTNGVQLSSTFEKYVFVFEFHKDHGFVKLTGKCLLTETDEPVIDASIDFIDTDKVPQEYPGIDEIIDFHHTLSLVADEEDPSWRERMINSSGFHNNGTV